MQPTVVVENVSKKYSKNANAHLAYGVSDLFREIFGRASDLTLRKDEFLAVDNVSFQLYPGDTFALIGRNGSGKTTLLKMMSGLTKPDGGAITVRGRVQALINLGAGFNAKLSGRDNIFNSAALMGMRQKQTRAIVDEIIEFAELEEFIDSPVGTYSSGMKSRLGFSVAVSLKPEILFVDEILAVGDHAFRNRCFTRMQQLKQRGVTIVLVSHSHNSVVQLCQRAMWLHRGKVMLVGPSQETVKAYLGFLEQEESELAARNERRRAERAKAADVPPAKKSPQIREEAENGRIAIDAPLSNWETAQESGWRAVGPSRPAAVDDGAGGAAIELKPVPNGQSNALEFRFGDGESMLGRVLRASADLKSSESGKLGFNLYYELDGTRKAFTKSHPGDGQWAVLSHEVSIPPSADPGSIRALISLRPGATRSAYARGLSALVEERDYAPAKGGPDAPDDPYDGMFGPIFGEFDQIAGLSFALQVNGKPADAVRIHDGVSINYGFDLQRSVQDLNVTLKFFRKDGLNLTTISTLNGDLLKEVHEGRVECSCDIPDFDFNPGTYVVVLAVHEGKSYLYRDVVKEFAVVGRGALTWGVRDFHYVYHVGSSVVYDTRRDP